MSAKLSPRRLAAFRALWRALRDGDRPGAPTLGERAQALPGMVGGTLSGRYPGMGRGRLGMLVLALAYLVSPVDAVPEMFVALLGLGDDLLVGAWLAGAVLVETERYLGWRRAGEPPIVTGEVVDRTDRPDPRP